MSNLSLAFVPQTRAAPWPTAPNPPGGAVATSQKPRAAAVTATMSSFILPRLPCAGFAWQSTGCRRHPQPPSGARDQTAPLLLHSPTGTANTLACLAQRQQAERRPDSSDELSLSSNKHWRLDTYHLIINTHHQHHHHNNGSTTFLKPSSHWPCSMRLLSKLIIPIRTLSNRMAAACKQDQQALKSLAIGFEQRGYAVLENFLTQEEVDSMRNEATRLIKEESRSEANKLQVFGNEINMKSRYFLDSSDKICYFFEKNAVNLETLELQLPEEQSLAKIAHALHSLNPVFNRVTASQEVQDVYRAIGFEQPTVVQSMVIFKNPKVGGAYTPHQDASFLYSDPPEHIAGVWLALDDATPENGCLEFIPGSHRWPLARRYVRTENTQDGENLLEWTAPVSEYDETQFVKVPVKKGDLVLIHGLVVHRSAANHSEKPRWIYTFHAYDKGRSQYSDKNWLQVNVNNTFMPLYQAAH